MSSLTTRRLLGVLGGAVLIAAALLLYRSLAGEFPGLEHRAGDREGNEVRVWRNRIVGQTARPPEGALTGIELQLSGPKAVTLRGPVTLEIQKNDDPSALRTVTLETGSFRRGAGSTFRFAPLQVHPTETLIFTLSYPRGTPERPLRVMAELPNAPGAADYAGGTFLEDGTERPGDLAFRLLYHGRRPFAIQFAAALGLLGAVLLARALIPRRATAVTVVLLAVGIPTLFALPLFQHPTFLGTGDWDMNTTMHAAAERALNREHQLPGWNPYLCGGTPLIGFPESPVFSPFFSTVLLGGPVVGFKANVLLHLLLGFSGFLLWLRRGWRMSWPAAFLGASILFFSSFVSLHLFAGHTRKIAIAWIPWVLFFLQQAMAKERGNLKSHILNPKHASSTKHQVPDARGRIHWNVRHWKLFGTWDLERGAWRGLRWCAPAGAALALMFFDGSVYLSLYTALFLVLVGIVESLRQRRLRPLVAAATILFLAGLIAGVQFGPILASERFGSIDLDAPDRSLPARGILDVFLDPNQNPYAVKFDGQPQPWHEYGAYVGAGAVLLAALGAGLSARRLAPWLLAGAVFFLGAFFPVAQRLLAALPILGDLRNPQRMAVMVTVVIALAAATGFDHLRRWLTAGDAARARPVSAALSLLAILAVGQTFFVSSETLAETFRIAPPPAAPDSPFRQGWARRISVGEQDSFVFTAESSRQNVGSVNRCSVASVQPSEQLRLPDEPDRDRGVSFRAGAYEGEAFLLSGRGRVKVEEQTTNTARLGYQSETPGTLALNMNAHRGWTVEVTPDGGPKRRVAAQPQQKLITAEISAGTGTVLFRYHPPGLTGGLASSVLGAALALWLWLRRNSHV